jgi:dephospho-CoA kinase
MESQKDLLIGLVGLFAAGKGEVAKFFMDKGFHYYSLSDELREMLRSEGKEITRDALHELGNRLRTEHGAGYLAELIRQKIKYPAVVDSIRNQAEVEELRKEKHFVLLSVESPIEVRYQRVLARMREGEGILSLEEFRQKEEMELAGSEAEQQTAKVIEMADCIVKNDSTLEALYTQLETLYSELTT